MRQLAAELGVSPMTPYRYFEDKDAILAAVRTRAFDRFAEALELAFAGGANRSSAPTPWGGLSRLRAQPSRGLQADVRHQAAERGGLSRAGRRWRALAGDHDRAPDGDDRQRRAEGRPGPDRPHVLERRCTAAVQLQLAGMLLPAVRRRAAVRARSCEPWCGCGRFTPSRLDRRRVRRASLPPTLRSRIND